MTTDDKPLRVLCLHGYAQHPAQFRARMGAFRKLKAFKKFKCTFEYIGAPFDIRENKNFNLENNNNNEDKELFGWWFHGEEIQKGYEWKDGLNYILKEIQEKGPFDAIIGFSQGATMTALILAHYYSNKDSNSIPPFKWAMLFSGYAPKQEGIMDTELFHPKPKIKLPCLLVHGKGDNIVPFEELEKMKTNFDGSNTVVHSHEEGHFIPTNANIRNVYLNFLEGLE